MSVCFIYIIGHSSLVWVLLSRYILNYSKIVLYIVQVQKVEDKIVFLGFDTDFNKKSIKKND